MDTDAMTNADLVATLAELVDEVLDRCDEYAEPEGDPAEGLRLAKFAHEAGAYGSSHRAFGRSSCLDFERVFTKRIVQAATLGDSSRNFGAFLREHPELTAKVEAPVEPFEFTDDELLAAIAASIEKWNAEMRVPGPELEAIWSSNIASTLAGRHATKSEVGRVVYRLRQLEARGYIERTNKEWEAVKWRLAQRGSRERHSKRTRREGNHLERD